MLKNWIDVYLNHHRSQIEVTNQRSLKGGTTRTGTSNDGTSNQVVGHTSRGVRRSACKESDEVVTLVIEDEGLGIDGRNGHKEVTICDMDPYILLVIFKHLPLKNRIAVQRVNKMWSSIISSLWLSQKILSFGYYPGLIAQSYKYSRSNAVYQMPGNTSLWSVFLMGNRKTKKKREVQSWPSILFQCKNLTILDISSLTNEFQVKHFKVSGEELATICPLISHFIMTNDGVSMLESYVNKIGKDDNKITIIEINSGWNSQAIYEPYFPYNFALNKKYDLKIAEIILKCPKLVKLYLDSILPKTLEIVLPQLTHLHINLGSIIDVDIISKVKCIKKCGDLDEKRCKNVAKNDILGNEMLSYLHVTNVDISCYQLRDLISNISYIKTLHIKSYVIFIKHLKCLKHLTDLQFIQSDLEVTSSADQKKEMVDSLRAFCDVKKGSLERLSLCIVSRTSADILVPVESLKSLTFLQIELSSSTQNEESQPTINLTAFPNLVTIKLTWVKMSDKQIKSLLKGNLSLRRCKFNYCNLDVNTTHHFVNYFFCLHPMISVKVSITAKKSSSKRGVVKKIVRRSCVSIKYVTPYEPYYPNDWYLALV